MFPPERKLEEHFRCQFFAQLFLVKKNALLELCNGFAAINDHNETLTAGTVIPLCAFSWIDDCTSSNRSNDTVWPAKKWQKRMLLATRQKPKIKKETLIVDLDIISAFGLKKRRIYQRFSGSEKTTLVNIYL